MHATTSVRSTTALEQRCLGGDGGGLGQLAAAMDVVVVIVGVGQACINMLLGVVLWRCAIAEEPRSGVLNSSALRTQAFKIVPVSPSFRPLTYLNEPSRAPLTDEYPRVFAHLSHDPQGHLEETVRAPCHLCLCRSHHSLQI